MKYVCAIRNNRKRRRCYRTFKTFDELWAHLIKKHRVKCYDGTIKYRRKP